MRTGKILVLVLICIVSSIIITTISLRYDSVDEVLIARDFIHEQLESQNAPIFFKIHPLENPGQYLVSYCYAAVDITGSTRSHLIDIIIQDQIVTAGYVDGQWDVLKNSVIDGNEYIDPSFCDPILAGTFSDFYEIIFDILQTLTKLLIYTQLGTLIFIAFVGIVIYKNFIGRIRSRYSRNTQTTLFDYSLGLSKNIGQRIPLLTITPSLFGICGVAQLYNRQIRRGIFIMISGMILFTFFIVVASFSFNLIWNFHIYDLDDFPQWDITENPGLVINTITVWTLAYVVFFIWQYFDSRKSIQKKKNYM